MTLAEDEAELVDYLRFILSRKLFIITGVLLCTVIVYFYALTLPKFYTATAKILVLKKPKFQVKSETKLITEDAEVGVNTQMNLLFSQEIAKRVLAALSAKYAEKVKNLTPQDILSSGSTIQISSTDLFELTVKSRDPELAKEICFFWTTEAIKYNDEIYSSENRDINNMVVKQYADVKAGMAETQAKILSFVTKKVRISKEVIDSKGETLIKNTDKIDFILEEIEKFENELLFLFDVMANDTIVAVERKISALSNELFKRKNNIERLKNNLKELTTNGSNVNTSSVFTVPNDELDASSDVVDRFEKNNSFKSSFESYSPPTKDRDRDRDRDRDKDKDNRSKDSSNASTTEAKNSLESEPAISITTNKDPMVFRTQLAIGSMKAKIDNLEFLISRFKKGLPELNRLFTRISKVRWLSLKREELINSATNFKLDLNSYIDFPGVNEIDKMLNDILLYAQKRSFLEQLKENNEKINSELKEYIINNENFDMEMNRLKEEYNFLKSSYETLGKKLEENRVQSAIAPSNIKMVEPPFTPTSPASPNIRKFVTITIFASAFLFIFLAFLLNALKNERIKK